jgi:hypothetical protein
VESSSPCTRIGIKNPRVDGPIPPQARESHSLTAVPA